jgi:hypothetical protein
MASPELAQQRFHAASAAVESQLPKRSDSVIDEDVTRDDEKQFRRL